MQKLLFTLFAFIAIVTVANAQDGSFKPSGNFWGYGFGDYYYVAHGDSLGRGAGNVQYKPNSNNSQIKVKTTSTVGALSISKKTGNDTLINTTTTTYTNILGNDGLNQTNENGFQLRRIYLGYDFKFTPNISASTVLAHEQNQDAGGYNTVYLKYWYLKWSEIFPRSTLILGQQVTPSFASAYNTEPLMGYRSNERTLMDVHNNDSSTDLGISLNGNIFQGESKDTIKPNILGYYLQFGNGNSAKPATTGFKTMRVNLYTSLLNQKLTIGVYGDFRPSNVALDQSTTTGKIYANFSSEIFSIGGEYLSQVFKNGASYNGTVGGKATTLYQDDAVSGWSIFVKGKIVSKLHYYARMDEYNPDTKYNSSIIYVGAAPIVMPTITPVGSASSYYTMSANTVSQAATFSKQTFFTVGFDFTPIKGVHIMPNVWYDGFSAMNSYATGKAGSDYTFVPRITLWVERL